MERLNDLGVGATTLRFRPYVLGVSDVTVDRMFARAKRAGVYSITTEFLCIEKRASANHLARYRAISEVCGFDVWEFYRKYSYSGSGLMRLNYDLKRPHIARMEELSKHYDIPLFISDAHHKEKSAAAGCCGLPSTGPLSNYNRGQFAEAIQIARRTGSVRWSDIESDAQWLKEVAFGKAEGYNQGDTYTRAKNRYHTMFDFMRDMWNTPKSYASPARYFGGALVPGELDAEGNIVYYYNKPFVEDGVNPESLAEIKLTLVNQREQLEADGGELGHVAYPVYVHAESVDVPAIKALIQARVNFTLFVPTDKAEALAEALPEFGIETYDGDPADALRSFASSEGLTHYWRIDGATRGFTLNGAQAGARAALSHGEASGKYDGDGCWLETVEYGIPAD